MPAIKSLMFKLGVISVCADLNNLCIAIFRDLKSTSSMKRNT
jgi:hypothetical protein